MLRIILIVHRYLGVFVGVLMSLWCLSGFVMMYQGFPATASKETLNGLPELDFSDCCRLSPRLLDQIADSGNFSIQALNNRPVMRATAAGPGNSYLALDTGQPLEPLSEEALLEVAMQFARGNGIEGQPELAGIIDIDQWTVQTARRNAPVWKVNFDDPAASVIYIAGNTGQVIQDTNRRERILTWLGAIPHWLYPLQLRQNGPLWVQVVIWTSVAGTFLTVTGVYVGIVRLRRRPTDGKLVSPFRGWWYWHHIIGLFFGVLVLTWIFSGLLTMNPWGWLAGDFGAFRYRAELSGQASPEDTRRFLAGLSEMNTLQSRTGVVRVESTPFNNVFYAMATLRDGSQVRLDADGNSAELGEEIIQAAVQGLSAPVKEFSLQEYEDQYYYGYKGESAALPVYRVILADEEQTRLYINPHSGSVSIVDANQKLNRWTRVGLHRLDFSFMKARPYWDVLVILLLAGVTVVSITGTWLSYKRIKLDYRRWHLKRQSASRR